MVDYSLSAVILCLANCGPPLTPQYGLVHPFASTLEGEEVLFSCSKHFQKENLTTLCSDNATWIPNPKEFCADHDQEHSTSGIIHGK
jgi:hypothetical protein